MGESEPRVASVMIWVEWQEGHGVGTRKTMEYGGGRANNTWGWRGCVSEKGDCGD